MSKINKIFNQVYRPLTVQAANNEEFAQGTMRKQFIHELVTHTGDLKMTKAGAASYYQMCRQRAEGKDMYASHKKWNKANKPEGNAIEDQPTAPTAPKVEVDMSQRWLVGNKVDKTVFASFATRTAAQTKNKELVAQGVESNWIDGSKIDKEEFTPTAVGL